MRYAIDTVSSRGRVIRSSYKRGGVLVTVDPHSEFIRLINPYRRVNGRPFMWTVRLNRAEQNEQVRLWYKPRCRTEEVIIFRELMKQLEAGTIQIVRKK